MSTFRLTCPTGETLPFEHLPGQFITLHQMIDGQRVTRCYTIASPPTRRSYCDFTVKRVPQGLSSGNLHSRVKEGDLLRISAPGGRFTFSGTESDKLLLIAGGVGITPLMAITRYLTDICWTGAIDLIVAAKTRAELIFQDELQLLKSRFPNFRLHIILSAAEGDEAWTGERGHLSPSLLNAWVANCSERVVYLCGPQPMMASVSEILQSMGLPASQLRTEAFMTAKKQREVADPELLAGGQRENGAPGGLGAEIRFSRSQRTGRAAKGQTVLELAEQVGVTIPFECRSGICGQCKTLLTAGTVVMDAEDALLASEKKAGYILACQALPCEGIVIEA